MNGRYGQPLQLRIKTLSPNRNIENLKSRRLQSDHPCYSPYHPSNRIAPMRQMSAFYIEYSKRPFYNPISVC